MEEKKELIRKTRTNGVRTQKHMAFRCDLDLLEWLKTKPNKGGLINTLLRKAMEKEKGIEDCADMPTDIEDNLK